MLRAVGTGRPQGIAPTFPVLHEPVCEMEQDTQHANADALFAWLDM
ncbi:MAG: hypothetical protein M3Y81_06270 [Chloroflexota bacterium]|nr:hypothetical protein [Chloroflexota bacterium]